MSELKIKICLILLLLGVLSCIWFRDFFDDENSDTIDIICSVESVSNNNYTIFK